MMSIIIPFKLPLDFLYLLGLAFPFGFAHLALPPEQFLVLAAGHFHQGDPTSW